MMVELIKKLVKGENLTAEEAAHAMTEIMTGQAGEIRTASFLTALAIKGETGMEIEAFARSMRKAALPWPESQNLELFDTCGTGGDALHTINISTLSALLLSTMGYPVAKHGNRAVSSTTGSADLLEEVGVPLELDPASVVACLEKVGITFLFAPKWHPAMKYAGPVRKAMGMRTVFNLLGPLTNPAPVAYQVVGVFSKAFLDPMATALAGLGRRGAYVVRSEDGLDEVSISASTSYIKIEEGVIKSRGTISPEDFGYRTASLSTLQVASREESVERSRRILAGKGSDEENATVVMNAALLYGMKNGIDDLKEAARHCMDVLKSGKAASTLQSWVNFNSGSTFSVGTHIRNPS